MIWKALLGVCVLWALFRLAKWSWFSIQKRTANRKARQQQVLKMSRQIEEVKELIALHGGPIPRALEQAVIEADVHDLLEMLSQKQVTSVQLMVCYFSRCLRFGVKLNAITDFNHREAFERAKAYDQEREELEQSGELPPLFGIPVSLKNNFIQEGFDASLAMVQHYGKLHDRDGLVVQVLRRSGAIPFVRTNLPVGVIGNENHNYIYGRVDSPWRPGRTPGGSSGGEAALISSGCSPLGFATDAAGSIRTPALFCGLYGFMVSPGRVSVQGTSGLGVDSRGWDIGSIGPICRSSRDLALVARVLVSSEQMRREDSSVRFMPWSEASFAQRKKFRVGLLKEPRYFTWTKAQKRVCASAADSLRRAGHEVVEFGVEHWQDLVVNFLVIAGNTLRDRVHLFKPNYTECESKLILRSSSLPDWCIRSARWLTSKLGRKALRSYHALAVADRLSEAELQKRIEDHKAAIQEVEREFRGQSLDALLVPGLNVAYRHFTSHGLAATHGSHIFANACGMCTGVLPVDLMRRDEEGHEDAFDDRWTELLRRTLEDGAGLPLGVQVCSLNGNDEACLGVMQAIESEFNFKQIIHDL